MKKILVFENDPHQFELTELYKWLKGNKITNWDFACTERWDLADVLKCGFDLVNKYDTIATETFFGTPKFTHGDREFEGGQIKEMMALLAAALPLRKKPLKVYYSQLIVGNGKITRADLEEYFTEDKFIRFSSITREVFEHKNFDLEILNLQ